ncbi:DUF5050 domain-containing protein [Paenibacillus sp. N3.4]|uniref:DUF5050 domain-containing protein n=1 Tax=Paenibacillus sp. N3.4 TaxID=2603222 RepID=UPI00164F9E01|nr:DUF5050 domain-containing protein [Paenibacillus sp. N3.4]
MRNKWAGYTVVFSLCMSLLVPAGHIRAKDVSVRVTLPDFSVNLNGHTVENQYREYPLLVYHDITYFPMTWYDTRLLGLETTWSPDDGLIIKQSRVASSYVPNKSERRNAASYAAEVPASAVKINGKTIDNSNEEYPLLSFRDVRYFPLTWRFAHDEFGWDYQWNDTGGLSITSHNLQLQKVGLPAYAKENDVALFKGYYYFVETTDTTNHVYRAPVKQPSDKEEIYSYNIKSVAYGLQKDLSFQIRDNMLWFTYHLGGGIMGGNYFVKIGGDGKAELLHQGYLDFRDTPYGTLIVNLGADNDSGNLYLSQPGQEGTNRKRVGDLDLKFAQHVAHSGVPATATSVVGDDVYVLCSPQLNDPNSIYKINLKTDKTEKIVSSSVNWFRIIGNKLYYVKDENNTLYSSALDGTGEIKLSDHAVSWFDSIDGNVFYTTKKEANRFELYQVDPNGKETLVWKTPVAGVQVLNDRLVCRFGENDDYGVVLLDGSGHLLLSVADPISRVLTTDDGILLQTSRDSSVELIR